MIKANELRINNKLIYSSLKDYLKDEYFTVKLVSEAYLIDEDDTTIGYYEIKPIPLTEEILLKCGFEKDNLIYFIECDAKFNIAKHPSKDVYRLIDFSGGFMWFKHLHQLQNLYFALTNKELEIKL